MGILTNQGVLEVIKVFMDNAPIVASYVLVFLMVIDYATGIIRAFCEKKSNSKTHYKGIIKKIGMVFGILVGALVDLVVNSGHPVFTTLIIMFFLSGEVLSIVENLGNIGVPMPKEFKERMEQINKRSDNGDEGVDENEKDSN